MQIQVIRPSNLLVLKNFAHVFRYYRLEDGCQFPMQVQIAWCHRCEDFVEAERLYSLEEIDHRISEYEKWRDDDTQCPAFEEFFFEHEAEWLANGFKLPQRPTPQERLHVWRAARLWREQRTMPRCLQCGSNFALKLLSEDEDIPHPAGTGFVRVQGDCVWGNGLPSRMYYDADGILSGGECSSS